MSWCRHSLLSPPASYDSRQANNRMEPTREAVCAIMSLKRAAHLARYQR